MNTVSLKRRPIKARDTKWAAAMARWLADAGIKPNTISLFSIVCAGVAGGSLVWSARWGPPPQIILLLLAAVFIQLRLLCNLFDGMVAVEGGLRSKSGEIFNELPDRFADALILIGAGYACPSTDWAMVAGWAAALLAVMTAYVRALGGVAGASQYFIGPMAKQQRMALITAACVLDAIGAFWQWEITFVALGLGIIVVGCLVTIGRRTRRIIDELNSK